MTTQHIFKSALVIACTLGFTACSLKEDLGSNLNQQQADSLIKASQLLGTAYDNLQFAYQDFSQTWGMSEISTDEALGPTRGGDWDDNGVWRALHQHQWTPDHSHVQATFSALLLNQFSATNVLNFHPTPRQDAEARFLRAYSMFAVLDLYGQVPFRKPGENLLEAPKVYQPAEGLDFIVSELNAILPNLPDKVTAKDAFVASKDAARFLLMKVYLNKGAFLNRKAPTFDAADMQKVIALADEITASGFTLQTKYFDTFAKDNDAKSTENIFTQQNGPGLSTARAGNNVYCRWMCTLHYSMNPSGWNGFTTLSNFYDSFESSDTRRGGDYPGVTNVSGLKVGFLVGQQYNQNGDKILDRSGRPLIFTREVELRATGDQVEMAGIRVVKYPPDMGSSGNNASNDFIFFRYADVVLMKAEALIRTNNAGAALLIVNDLRGKRGASQIGSTDLTQILAERGRELYWEGWRRQDLIRFGKFLDAWQLKTVSDPKYLVYPIPTSDLAVNPNLKQNPGY
ncbi:RagB/SusD family nutrient uptake outer membrane protein [Chitinophaga arvensicola]|uniref:Starch-binding associating with outer membrane n=1 Tax=Chitinophaga arvensicola TaxID=29529 RepID=A0A1I0PGG6_9BACT|nr:RagB/SusD family nutrient uptake outer membrane protein [Chitinophaga arvensicola]SEW13356.1 Starch-binding associating with outer membrane [Chitinophaga arvensicola]